MSYYDELKKKRKTSAPAETAVATINTEESSTSSESYYDQLKKKRQATIDEYYAAEEKKNTPDWSTYDVDSARAELEQKQATYDKYFADVDKWKVTVNDSKIRLIDVERQLNQSWGLTSKQRKELENEANALRSKISAGEEYVSSFPFDFSAAKSDIDKLTKEIESAQAWRDQKAREDETNRLYGEIIASPDYEEILQKHESDSFYEGSIGDLLKKTYGAIFNPQNAGNRITAANAITEYDPKTLTSYNSGAKNKILPKFMNEKEQLVYNAYYYRGEYDKAEEYYKSIEGDLEERARSVANTNAAQFAKDKPFWSSAQSVGHSVFGTPTEAAVDLIKYGIDAVKDPTTAKLDRNDMADTVNITRQTVSEDMTPVGRFFYNTTMSGLDSLLSGLVFGNVAGVTLALSAGSSTYNEALDRGMSNGQAMAYGIASGLFEGIFESWSLGNLEALKEISPKTWKDVVLNIAKSMGVNAGEEMATEIANLTYDSIANGEFSQFAELREQGLSFWDIMGKFGLQTLESGASGALMGFGFGSTGSAMGWVNNKINTTAIPLQDRSAYPYSMATVIQEYIDNINTDVLSYAQECRSDKNTTYKRIKISDVSERQANDAHKLLNLDFTGYQNSVERSALNHIEKRHGEHGVADTSMKDLNDVSRIGYVLDNYDTVEITTDADGNETFSKQFRDKDNNPAPLLKYSKKINGTYYAVIACPDAKYKKLWLVSAYIEQKKDSTVTQESDEKTPNGTPKAKLASPYAVNNSISHSDGIVNRENLSSVDVQVAEFAKILKIGEQGVHDLNNVISSMGEGIDVANAVQAYNAVYQMGKQGKDISEARNPHLYMLSAEQKEIAYNAGFMDSVTEKKSSDGVLQKDGESGKTPKFLDEEHVNEAQKRIDESKSPDGKKKKGAVIYDGDRSKLSDMQRKSLDILDKVAEALGVTFHIFESKRENGKFVYKTPSGKKTSANGWYDKKTGEIWIDINAGNNGEGLIIFTAAHELTHFIREWSAKKFKVFAEFLLEQYRDHGISVDELVQRQIDKAKRNGRDIDWDEAYEEVIADSCETFLRDSNAVEKIAELNQKDAGLVQKIKQFLKNMLKGLRELMSGINPETDEGKIVSDMESSLQKLYDLWTDALIDAGEAYSAADDIKVKVDEDTGILYMERNGDVKDATQLSVKDLEYLLEQAQYGVLKDKHYIPLRRNTPEFFTEVVKDHSKGTYFVEDYPIASQVEHIRQNMEEEDGLSYGDHRPHGFSVDDIITISRKMGDPSYIVLQENKRYAMVVSFYNKRNKKVVVSIDFANPYTVPQQNYKHSQYMNGYSEGCYNIVVTQYEPDDFQDYLSKCEVIYDKTKMNGKYQVGSGRVVTVTHDTPFIEDIIPQPDDSVKSEEEKILLSDRDPDALTNREMLASILESRAQTDREKLMLEKYKAKLADIETDQAELDKTKAELHELYFAKGKRNTAKIAVLEARREKLQKRIDNADSWLLKYDMMKPIKDLVEREKTAAYKKAVAEGNSKLAEYRERVKAREDEIRQGYREARERASDRRHSGDIRKKIKEFKDKLQKTLLHPTEKKYIPGALAQAMIDVCELINTDTDAYKADGSVNKAQEKRVQTREKLARLREEYKKIKNDADPLYAGEFDEVIADYLEKLESKFKDKPLDEMSLAELNEMYNILHSIDGTLKDARKLIGQKESVDIYDAGDAIIAEQRAIVSKRKNGTRGAFKKIDDGVANQSLSPMRRVLEICGYNKESPLYKLFKDFEVGVRKAKFFMMGARKSFDALTTGRKNSKIYENAVYEADGGNIYTDVKGRKFGISKMQKMQAILSYERETTNKKTQHIAKGGLVFGDLKAIGKGNLKEAIASENSHRVTGDNAVKMIEQFKKELESDRWAQEYMTAARVFFNDTAKTAINDTYMQLKHRILATEDAYIPFEVDRNSIVREISAKYDIQETISSYGMLQETQKGSSNALIITGLNNVLDRHIEQVGTIKGLAVAIRNFNKVWNVKSIDGSTNVREQIEASVGRGGVKSIEQAVQDIQGERSVKLSHWYKTVKSNYIRATFFMNMSVRLKQIGSMFSATSVIKYRDPVRMLANLIYTRFNQDKIAAEVDKYTATAYLRRQGLSDAELQSLSTEKKRTWIGKLLTEGGSKGMIHTDYLVALSLWKYAKQDVAKETGLRGEELLKATAEYYDEVIETTQSMTDVLHRPEIQRSGGIGTELLGTFKTDLYQNAGNLRIAMGEFVQHRTKENARKLGKVVSAIMTSAMWGSVVTSLMAILRYKPDRYRDEEDDELTAESWLKVQGMDMLEEFAGYIFPYFGSETVDIIQGIASGSNAYSDNFVSSISFDAINDVFTAISKLTSDFKDEDDLTFEDFEDLIISCGNVFGVPTSNLIRTGKSIYMHARDIANGDFLSFNEGYYSSTKISKTDKLYRAMINDDKDRINEIKAQFKNESDAISAIKKAIREKDPRVHKAVEAALSGDYGIYNDAKNAVRAEKHFDAKTVNNAFADEREYVLEKLSDARKARRQGDFEEYEKIVEQLVDRGYSEEFVKMKLK